jgi:hypothetical protein
MTTFEPVFVQNFFLVSTVPIFLCFCLHSMNSLFSLFSSSYIYN